MVGTLDRIATMADGEDSGEIAVQYGFKPVVVWCQHDLVDKRADERHRFGLVGVIVQQQFELGNLAGIEIRQVRM